MFSSWICTVFWLTAPLYVFVFTVLLYVHLIMFHCIADSIHLDRFIINIKCICIPLDLLLFGGYATFVETVHIWCSTLQLPAENSLFFTALTIS